MAADDDDAAQGRQPNQNWTPPSPLEPPASGRPRWPWIVSAVVAVLVVIGGAGGFLAYTKLHSSGQQPEKALPADVFAFAKLDADPSASQKIAAMRFLHRVPSLKSDFDEGKDPARAVFDELTASGDLPADLDYDRDIKPWMGDRIAVAVRPGQGPSADPDTIVAVQASDEGKARAAISRIVTDPDDVGMAYRNGYLLLSGSQLAADRASADAARATLAEARVFRSDMNSLGEDGVASGWVDLAVTAEAATDGDDDFGSALGRQLGGGSISADGRLDDLAGRAFFAVRFHSDSVELVAKVAGAGTPASAAPAADSLASLPASTGFAVQVGGVDVATQQLWDRLTASDDDEISSGFDDIEDEFGLTLPTDLVTVLGKRLVVSVDRNGLADGTPEIAIRALADPAKAADVLRRVDAAFADHDTEAPYSWQQVSDGVVGASSDDYLAELASPSGPRLGDQAAFKAALPDLRDARASVYIDMAAVAAVAERSGADRSDLDSLSAFRAIGVTATSAGGASTVLVRLVAN